MLFRYNKGLLLLHLNLRLKDNEPLGLIFPPDSTAPYTPASLAPAMNQSCLLRRSFLFFTLRRLAKLTGDAALSDKAKNAVNDIRDCNARMRGNIRRSRYAHVELLKVVYKYYSNGIRTAGY